MNGRASSVYTRSVVTLPFISSFYVLLLSCVLITDMNLLLLCSALVVLVDKYPRYKLSFSVCLSISAFRKVDSHHQCRVFHCQSFVHVETHVNRFKNISLSACFNCTFWWADRSETFKSTDPSLCSRSFIRHNSRSFRHRWLCRLRRKSTAARLLGLRFRNPLAAWLFVSCLLCSSRPLPRADHSSREFPECERLIAFDQVHVQLGR